MFVKCSKIYVDRDFNCRGRIVPQDVVNLSRDIEQRGQLTPIWVRPIVREGYEYSLIAGFRRFTAISNLLQDIKLPGMPESGMVEVLVKEVDEATARILNLVENLQREDLNILQEARAIQNLADAGYNHKQIAVELKKSVPWVEARFALLALPDEIQNEAAAGFLTQDHIKKLVKMKTKEEQYATVRKIKDRKILGERSVPLLQHKNIHSKKARNRHEVGFMRDHIYDTLGASLITRFAAWVGGEISDYDLYVEIKAEADRQGKAYTVPKEVLSG